MALVRWPSGSRSSDARLSRPLRCSASSPGPGRGGAGSKYRSWGRGRRGEADTAWYDRNKQTAVSGHGRVLAEATHCGTGGSSSCWLAHICKLLLRCRNMRARRPQAVGERPTRRGSNSSVLPTQRVRMSQNDALSPWGGGGKLGVPPNQGFLVAGYGQLEEARLAKRFLLQQFIGNGLRRLAHLHSHAFIYTHIHTHTHISARVGKPGQGQNNVEWQGPPA
jgi:hypothetical protein